MSRLVTVILVLVSGACKTAPARIEQEPRTRASESQTSAHASEPPPLPGTALPKLFGDGPPRQADVEPSSTWTLGQVQHEVPCDTLQEPQLRAVLRVLFSGAPPNDTSYVASPHARERLRIDWREHGKRIAVTRLLDDGTLLRDRESTLTVERRLSPETLTELEATLERAELRSSNKRWCAAPH